MHYIHIYICMYMASYYDLSVCCCIFFYKFYEQHIKSTSFFIDWCDESYGSSLLQTTTSKLEGFTSPGQPVLLCYYSERGPVEKASHSIIFIILLFVFFFLIDRSMGRKNKRIICKTVQVNDYLLLLSEQKK